MSALNSSRLAIGNALVALLQNITNPNTSQSLYQLVKLGAVFDPGSFTTWAEVIHLQGKGTPAGSGGNMIGWRIDDEVTFMITSAVGLYQVDDSAVQATMLALQDILLPTLHQHFQLPVAGNPTQAVESVYSVLPIQVDKSRPVRFPNGNVYLFWDVPVVVKQQFNVELVQP